MSYEIQTVNNDAITEGTKEAAILQACIILTAEAKIHAPVDTGLLRNSIMWKYKDNEGGHEDGEKLKGYDKNNGYVGTNVEYAPYVEFGTRYQRAQPFMTLAGNIAVRKMSGEKISSQAVSAIKRKIRWGRYAGK